MAAPIRNISQGTIGTITATPSSTLRRLAVRVMNVRGATRGTYYAPKRGRGR